MRGSGSTRRNAYRICRISPPCSPISLVAQPTESASFAEALRERGSATVDEIVKSVKPKGRASVPDDVKAELLGQLRAVITAT